MFTGLRRFLRLLFTRPHTAAVSSVAYKNCAKRKAIARYIRTTRVITDDQGFSKLQLRCGLTAAGNQITGSRTRTTTTKVTFSAGHTIDNNMYAIRLHTNIKDALVLHACTRTNPKAHVCLYFYMHKPQHLYEGVCSVFRRLEVRRPAAALTQTWRNWYLRTLL